MERDTRLSRQHITLRYLVAFQRDRNTAVNGYCRTWDSLTSNPDACVASRCPTPMTHSRSHSVSSSKGRLLENGCFLVWGLAVFFPGIGLNYVCRTKVMLRRGNTLPPVLHPLIRDCYQSEQISRIYIQGKSSSSFLTLLQKLTRIAIGCSFAIWCTRNITLTGQRVHFWLRLRIL